jgi:hypothetical protein
MTTLISPVQRIAKGISGHSYALATYMLILVVATAAVLLVFEQPLLALLLAGLLCGWAEVDGACGTSHVGALTPLYLLGRNHKLWRRAVLAYTVGGVITAASVGAIIGVCAWIVISSNAARFASFAFAAALASILALRELGAFAFQLPQVHRQTNKLWALDYGFVPGAAMWGAHIGLGFATVIRHGGLFAIGAAAFCVGSWSAVALVTAFWIGRTLPLWISPSLTSNHADGGELMDLVRKDAAPYRHCAAAGLLCATLALLVLASRI